MKEFVVQNSGLLQVRGMREFFDTWLMHDNVAMGAVLAGEGKTPANPWSKTQREALDRDLERLLGALDGVGTVPMQ